MSNYPDSLDDLPIFSPSTSKAKSEPVPMIKSFRNNVSKRVGLRQKKNGRKGASRGGSPRRGRMAESVYNVGSSARRVVVKARVVKMNNLYGKKSAGLHMKYIERDGAGKDGKEAELFDSKTSNKDLTEWTEKNIEWAEHTEGEPHQFRVIISPEDAHELNLTEYTRELMERVQTDLGRDLVWTAANHYNTDNPHTHLVISGLDTNGEEVWIDREYISNGIRNRARELATQELGHRSELEIDTTLNKEITQERFTSLDWKIDKVSHGNIVDMSVYPDDIDARKLHGKLIARLDHLVGYGLAIKDNSHEYILQDGWDTNLREMGERGDIIKTLHKEIKADPTKYRIYDKDDHDNVVTGRLVRSGLHDELNDRFYMIVEGQDGSANYIVMDKVTDVTEYKRGSIVSVENYQDSWIKKSDYVIETFARSNQGIYDQKEHVEQVIKHPELLPNNVTPEGYTDAIGRRVSRLARFGLAQQLGSGLWKIEENLTAELSRRDQESPNPRKVRISTIDERLLQQQIKAEGRAWIDTIHVENNAPYSFGSELNQAIKKRQEFMQKELGLKGNEKGLLKMLDNIERQKLVQDYADSSLRHYKPLKQEMFTGTLHKKITAPSGQGYALITSGHNNGIDKEFSLVPWRDNMKRSLGKPVSFGLSKQNIPIVKTLTKGLQR